MPSKRKSKPHPTTSYHESKGAIFTALAANIGIAVSKFIAFLLTGATSLLAEAVHSVADSSNQILLLIGSHQSKRKATRTHPFGYGRAHFLYGFIVSIVLFSLGGMFAVYEGIEKIQHPVMIDAPIIAYTVIVIAMVFEGTALRTALHEVKGFKPKTQSWWRFFQETKSINHIVLALEDSAALIGLTLAGMGVTLALVTGSPVWDGISTLLIGLLLVAVAVILFREVQSLLIGEAVDVATERKIRKTILEVDDIDQVVDLKTLYTGPQELFIAMKVIVGRRDTAYAVARAIDEVEARLRQEFPIARLIYIEPDIYKSREQQKISDHAIKETLE